MDRSRVALGRWGEALVARHYESAGYLVVDRNWQIRGGELDLVLTRGDEIIFCEVKTRSTTRFGHGAESVDHRKQSVLRRAAMKWLAAHQVRGNIRFDVVSVTGGRIEVIEAAF